MTLKVTQGHQNCCYSMATRHFLNNSNSILHSFQDITVFTVYATAYDLEKSNFDKTVEVTSHVRFVIHV